MSARQSVYVSIVEPAPSPPSPNATVAAITAEIRVFWPPGQVDLAAHYLREAYADAMHQLDTRETR